MNVVKTYYGEIVAASEHFYNKPISGYRDHFADRPALVITRHEMSHFEWIA